MMNDTIAAVATPQGRGGIAVIRVSGEEAVSICDRIYRGSEKLASVASHTIHYGHIAGTDGDVDEVLVSVMRAPRTYTREDVVEISTHGGFESSRRVMRLLIKCGARPAEPGEFTKRAFLNGRIDLSQAEGVIDIINARTELEQKNALSQAEGGLSREINAIRTALVHLAAQMQVAIDYPDEDLEEVTESDIVSEVKKNSAMVKKLIRTADSGRILRDGIKTVIVGKPNVGKSSLLNYLAREERAIVTDVPGTTRDVIEESVNVRGVMMRLLDTAGIRYTSDRVEKIGIERSKRAAEEADLVIVVLDLSRDIDDDDRELLSATENKKRIIVYNKTDIADCAKKGAIGISAKTGDGIDALCDEIKKLYNLGQIEQSGGAVITNMRHLSALEKAEEALARAGEAIGSGLPQDMAALDIYEAINSLGEITGDTVSEDIVTEIFHNFCVGK